MGEQKVTAVVPCYNVSRACLDVIEGARGRVDRVIAVDDGSTDDTLACLRGSGCEVIHLPVNRGKGVALRHGFEAALAGGCDFVVTLDGDGQHRPEEIDALVDRAVADGSDLVVGVRRIEEMPVRSQLGNLWTKWFYRAQTGRPLPDTQSGFRLFRASALRGLMGQISWGRFEAEMDMLFRFHGSGLRVTTAPISTVYFDENRLTTFRTLTDSMRVFFVVARYAAAGISSALLEFALFGALVWSDPGRYAWALLAARAAALVNHYLVSRFFVFRLRRRVTLGEAAKYACVAALNLAASYGLLWLMIGRLGMHAILSKAISQSILFVITFVLLQKFAFRARQA